MVDVATSARSTDLQASGCAVARPISPQLSSELLQAESSARSIRPVGGLLKRGLDLLIAFAMMPVLLPLLACIAFAVRLESKGPALFRQRRGGFRGRTFIIYKFRTMTALEDGQSVQQAKRGDSRITNLGAVLRKTSLDELPQLINVLRGEMSFVGPRPHALAHDKTFIAVEPDYVRRFEARPGITGLAQTSGSRGPTDTPESVRERIAFDLAYIDSWSPWLDVKIVARTALGCLWDKNAF